VPAHEQSAGSQSPELSAQSPEPSSTTALGDAQAPDVTVVDLVRLGISGLVLSPDFLHVTLPSPSTSPRRQTFRVCAAHAPAVSPFVQRCQTEYAARTPHESLGGDRQQVPGRLTVRSPAETFQRGSNQRRLVTSPHERQVVALDVHQTVVVYRCGDRPMTTRFAGRACCYGKRPATVNRLILADR
jgi:hypothetical protein